MKTKNLIFIAAIFIMFVSVESFGQRGMRGNQEGAQCVLPDLTEEQETKINALRTERIASSTQHQAEMNELRARKRSLTLADNPDMNEVNSIIDQMADKRAQQMKARVQHRQEVRELLTPEQRVIFDSQSGQRRAFGQREGYRNSEGRGQGRFNDDSRRGRRR